MKDKHKTVLQKVALFEPIEVTELQDIVPECESYEIPSLLRELSDQGYITNQNDDAHSVRFRDSDTVSIDTTTARNPDSSQQQLIQADQVSPTQQVLPDDIPIKEAHTLELSTEQLKLFEKMRTNVSQSCGEMNKEEFVDWILREARRMTEV